MPEPELASALCLCRMMRSEVLLLLECRRGMRGESVVNSVLQGSYEGESVVNAGFDTGLRLESVVNSEFEAIEGIFGGGGARGLRPSQNFSNF